MLFTLLEHLQTYARHKKQHRLHNAITRASTLSHDEVFRRIMSLPRFNSGRWTLSQYREALYDEGLEVLQHIRRLPKHKRELYESFLMNERRQLIRSARTQVDRDSAARKKRMS